MLAVTDLSFAYGEDVVLESVSLAVDPGEFVLLTGPNGAGKTTLVRHFNGLLEPDAGSVEIDGISVGDDPVHARTAVGLVFQQPADQFVGATVGADVAFGPENLGLDRGAVADRVERALDIVGMAGGQDRPIADLSGGEQTRVALAGVLAMEPDYVVLDEPFGQLDVHARGAVRSHLATLVESGTAVVLVTHDLRDAWTLSDRVIALEEGQVAVEGAPADVRGRLTELAVVPEATEA